MNIVYEITDDGDNSVITSKNYRDGTVISTMLIPKTGTVTVANGAATVQLDVEPFTIVMNRLQIIKPVSSDDLDLAEKLKFMVQSVEGGTTPFISSIEDRYIAPSTQKTLIVNGGNFSPETQIKITDWPGTIDSVLFLAESRILVTVTSSALNGTYPLYAENGNLQINSENIEVTTNPTGPVSFLKTVAGENNIQFTAFAKSEQGQKVAANAFDGDIGTRHECGANQQVGHYVGLLLNNVPTWILSWKLYSVDDSNEFELQGSNDTTDGHDGTWTAIDSQIMVDGETVELSGINIYSKGIRILWTNPLSNRVGVRDVTFTGRQ